MSNSQVGAVYQQIISDVIETSRIDFEEGGVEESVLEELKKVSNQHIYYLSIPLFSVTFPDFYLLPRATSSLLSSSSSPLPFSMFPCFHQPIISQYKLVIQ